MAESNNQYAFEFNFKLLKPLHKSGRFSQQYLSHVIIGLSY